MTLQFLGDAYVSHRGARQAQVAQVVSEHVKLTLDRIGYWPRSGILWLGPRKAPRALNVRCTEIFNQLRALGYRADGRGFKAHVTLARVACVAKHLVFSPVIWQVETMVLAASKRLPQGAHYQVVAQLGTAEMAPIR